MAEFTSRYTNSDRGENPRNEQSTLFKQLTRLFSGPIASYDKQTARKLKRQSLEKYKNRFKSLSGQSFKKSEHNPFRYLHHERLMNRNRAERYIDFDQMEYSAILGAALDIYADEICTTTQMNDILNINCENERIRSVLRTLYYDILNAQHNLYGWTRTMCKYGDFFLYLDVDEKQGVTNAIGLPTHEIERLEGLDENNPNYTQFQWNSAGMTFERWQVCHFRLLGNDKYNPYGTSVLEPARRIWRQLVLLEDAVMAYRIVRSPERRVFYIDVGGIDPSNVEEYIQQTVTEFKRHTVVDEDTGQVDLRYDPLSIEEDYYIPVRGGDSQTRIEKLKGGEYTGDIDDVKYLRDKLLTAIKIPQPYLTYGEDANSEQSSLAQKDIRFARTIQRLQQQVVSQLRKIGVVHLYTLGFDDEDLMAFDLELNNPSRIAEMQELEQWRTKLDVGSMMSEQDVFSDWHVAQNIYDMSEEEFMRNRKEKIHDAKYSKDLTEIEEGGMMDEEGLGGELGGDLEGLEGGEEELEEPFGGEGEEPGEEGELLSAPEGEEEPAKRGDEEYTTPRAKGKKYKPETSDKRDMGARKRSTLSKGGERERGSSRRKKMPGMDAIESLKSGIYEKEKEALEEEKRKEFEKKLSETEQSTKELIKELKRHDSQQET